MTPDFEAEVTENRTCLSFLVDAPMVSISKLHVAYVSSYRIHKLGCPHCLLGGMTQTVMRSALCALLHAWLCVSYMHDFRWGVKYSNVAPQYIKMKSWSEQSSLAGPHHSITDQHTVSWNQLLEQKQYWERFNSSKLQHMRKTKIFHSPSHGCRRWEINSSFTVMLAEGSKWWTM